MGICFVKDHPYNVLAQLPLLHGTSVESAENIGLQNQKGITIVCIYNNSKQLAC